MLTQFRPSNRKTLLQPYPRPIAPNFKIHQPPGISLFAKTQGDSPAQRSRGTGRRAVRIGHSVNRIPKRVSLLLPKLAVEMAFNIFTAQRFSLSCQYHRIDDLVPFNLCSDECSVFRQFLIDEFYFPAVLQCFNPLLVLHCLSLSSPSECCGSIRGSVPEVAPGE
jgi:hypothetical protein